jgi:thioredoxin reductase (NADPH)
MADSDIYDVVVVGAGCAGCAAAMYAARFGMKVLMLGELPGGTITLTHIVENYPGIESISGLELGEKLLHHAQAYGAKLEMAKATKIEKKSNPQAQEEIFAITSDSSKTYLARTIIAATGTEWKKLGVPGEKEYANKGVHYCALCDGAFYKNKIISVVGSGDSAAKESLLLAEYGSHVYIFVRGPALHGEPINNKRVFENKKITVFTNTQVKEIIGKNGKMTHLKLSRPCAPADGEPTDLFATDALFVLIGNSPLSSLFEEIGVAVNEKKEILVDREMKTNVAGIFAAGDVTNSPFKQAIVSAAEGVIAAYSAYHYISDKK